MARRKKVLPRDITREQAEDAFARYADADARQPQIAAKMDVQITRIREKYADAMDALQEVQDKSFEDMHAFAEGNRDVFGKRKSLEMAHGVIGFRTGTPKLKTLKGFTWASATNLIREFLPDYLKVKETPAKDRLLADREDP